MAVSLLFGKKRRVESMVWLHARSKDMVDDQQQAHHLGDLKPGCKLQGHDCKYCESTSEYCVQRSEEC